MLQNPFVEIFMLLKDIQRNNRKFQGYAKLEDQIFSCLKKIYNVKDQRFSSYFLGKRSFSSTVNISQLNLTVMLIKHSKNKRHKNENPTLVWDHKSASSIIFLKDLQRKKLKNHSAVTITAMVTTMD